MLFWFENEPSKRVWPVYESLYQIQPVIQFFVLVVWACLFNFSPMTSAILEVQSAQNEEDPLSSTVVNSGSIFPLDIG